MHVPAKQIINHKRPSSPLFNHRCNEAKVVTRRPDRRNRRTHDGDDLRLWRAQLDFQHIVFQQEYASFWSRSIEGCRDSKSLWQKMSSFLHPVTSSSSPHSAGDFNNFLPVRSTQFEPPRHQHQRRLSISGMFHYSLVSVLCRSTRYLASYARHPVSNVLWTLFRRRP